MLRWILHLLGRPRASIDDRPAPVATPRPSPRLSPERDAPSAPEALGTSSFAPAEPGPSAGLPVDDLAPDGLLPDMRHDLFGWFTGRTPEAGPLTPLESRLLRHLDAIVSADDARGDLLPRAPSVIPQLMRALRECDGSDSVATLVARIEREPNLVAEVTRLANGAATRGHGAVNSLGEAIRRVGAEGLKRAIAKVVLKPVFDAPAGSLSGHAASRLWQHSEAQAAEATILAEAAGLDPFDGYLAGLLHNIGWSAVLRAIDRHPGGLPATFTEAFVDELAPRRATLFGLLAMPWQLSDALTLLAVERLDPPPPDRASPLAAALDAADRHATYEVLGAGAMVEAMA